MDIREQTIPINVYVLKSVLTTLQNADKFSSAKANVGYKGRYSVENTDMLTIACMVSSAQAELLSYMSDDEYSLLKEIKLRNES